MKHFIKSTAFFIVLFFCVIATRAQDTKPYTDGSVWHISYVQTKSGMKSTYLKDLAQHWARVMDEAKKQNLIMDYQVISSPPGDKSICRKQKLRQGTHRLKLYWKKFAPVLWVCIRVRNCRMW